MDSDVTNAELVRRLSDDREAFKDFRRETDRRFNDYISKAFYERDITEIRTDVTEIKDTLKWAARALGGLFIAVIIDIIVRVATSGVVQ